MANRYAGTTEQKTALDAYVKLWRAAQAVEGAANRYLANFNLTLSQFGAIEALYHLGPLNQRQLAGKILRSTGNLTMVIDNLERDGLVQRQRDPLDKRVINVSLTEAGQALIEQILPVHVEGIRQIFDVIEPEEVEQLTTISRKLGLSLTKNL